MEKTKIPIIILAIFSIAMLDIQVLNDAYAQAPPSIVYEVTTDNSGRDISGGTNHIKFDGEEFTSTSVLLGVSISRVDLKINCARADLGGGVFDTLGGTAYVGIWDGSIAPTSSNYKRLIASFAPVPFMGESNCVSGGFGGEYKNFTMTSAYTIQSGDVLGLFYDYPTFQSGTWLSLRHSTSNQFDGTATRESYYDPSPAGWNDVTTSDINMVLWINALPPTSGIDCNLPENANILTCRLATIGNTPLAGASQLVNASSTDLACQIGLIACTDGEPDDTNIQTNGIGYILLMVALGIWVGILWVASRGQLTEIPNFVWMVGTIAVVGAVTVVGWIDPTILIVSIITVIALAGIKAKNIFTGVGGMFKGESA